MSAQDRSAGRWCAKCQQHGSHHTDRHDEFTPDRDAVEREALIRRARFWAGQIKGGETRDLIEDLIEAVEAHSPRPAEVSEKAIRADERAKVAERIEKAKEVWEQGWTTSESPSTALGQHGLWMGARAFEKAARVAGTAPAEDGAE